jgi:hypothetical protein
MVCNTVASCADTIRVNDNPIQIKARYMVYPTAGDGGFILHKELEKLE